MVDFPYVSLPEGMLNFVGANGLFFDKSSDHCCFHHTVTYVSAIAVSAPDWKTEKVQTTATVAK